jgi:hypothetical protein
LRAIGCCDRVAVGAAAAAAAGNLLPLPCAPPCLCCAGCRMLLAVSVSRVGPIRLANVNCLPGLVLAANAGVAGAVAALAEAVVLLAIPP